MKRFVRIKLIFACSDPLTMSIAALVAFGAAQADEQGTETFAFDEGFVGW